LRLEDKMEAEVSFKKVLKSHSLWLTGIKQWKTAELEQLKCWSYEVQMQQFCLMTDRNRLSWEWVESELRVSCTTAQVRAANWPVMWSGWKQHSDSFCKGPLDLTKHTSTALPDCTVSLH
jgi:hypothetical protein